MEAQPTTYKGVLLRSKSEAVFIRAVELSGCQIWEYEPERFKVDEWTPDFWLISSRFSSKLSKQVIISLLVEYKPGPITVSYKDLLKERFNIIKSRMLRHTVIPILAYANAFDPSIPRGVQELYDGDWAEGIPAIHKFFFQHLEEARSYRFDLQ